MTADVFYIAWTGIQQQIALPTCGDGFDTNVGNATSFGAEGDIRYRPIPSLTFGIAASCTHATLDQGSTVVEAQKGQAVEGVPDWNATASIGCEHAITRHTKSFIRANWNWVGRSQACSIRAIPTIRVRQLRNSHRQTRQWSAVAGCSRG